MRVEILQYDIEAGTWSVERLPALDSEQTLVLAFGASEVQSHPSVFQLLRSNYPSSHLLGCSTAGEIHNGTLRDGTMSVAVIQFAQTGVFSTGVVVRRREESENAGRELGRRLPRDGLRAVMLLTEGLAVDHRALLDGLHIELGFDIPMIGTLASDGRRFERTWVWLGERIQSGLCAAVGLYGPNLLLHSHATDEWTHEQVANHVITKASDNIVFEIDGRPALDVCRLPPGGLRGLRSVDDSGPIHVANALGVDEARRAVILSHPLAEGSRVQVLPGNQDDLFAGAASAAIELKPTATALSAGGGGVLALAMSSIGRRLALGEEAGREPSAVVEQLAGVPLIGLYTYGEFAVGADSRMGVRHSGLRVVLLGEDLSGPRAAALPPQAQFPAAEVSPSGSASISEDPMDTSGSTLSGARPLVKELGAASATIYQLDSLRFIALQGTLNETFDPKGLTGEMFGRVVLDVAGVGHITSFGVRGWLEMMSACDPTVSHLYLANLSEAIVNQMLMVRNFAGKGQIVSFGAPYICTACSKSFEFLLDCEHAAEEIREASPPDVACPDCGNRAVFDDDPTSYFEFVLQDLSKQLPGDVRNALAERRLEWMSQVEESIEKRVEGERTVFHIDRNVDEKIRWQRVMSGVEGMVRLDFTRCKGATQVGTDRLLTALRISSDPVTAILFDQVPLAIIEQMIHSERIPKLTVRTISVPARCANCGVVRYASIDPAGIREAKRQGLQPESECRRCSGSIPVALPPEVTAYFEGAQPTRPILAGGSVGLPPRLLVMVAGAVVAAIALVVVIVRLL